MRQGATWLVLLVLLLAGSGARAQVIKTLPGSYGSFRAAITDINANYGAGGITVLVAAGYTDQLSTALPLLTAQGSASRPIVFRRVGLGGNPRIVAPAGTSATTDAIVGLAGADYVTFDGIDLLDPSTHANQTTAAEFGYAFFRASATNGCQNNTIQNCVVSMNRAGGNSTSGVVYGIYGASTTATGAAVATTAASGANSYNNVYANTILNTQAGIYLNGYDDPNAPYSLLDQDNDIGGSAASTGNTIMNFGGLTAAPAYGIWLVNQNDGNASFNSLNNAGNGGVACTSAFYGILFGQGRNASATIRRNYIIIGQAANNSPVTGIQTALSGTGTVTVQDNTLGLLVAASNGAASTGPRYLLANTGATTTLIFNSNAATIELNSSSNTTIGGTTYGVYNAGAVAGATSLSNNRVAYTLSGTNSGNIEADCYGVYNANTGQIGGSLALSNNNISYQLAARSSTLTGDAAGVANAGPVAGSLALASNTVSFSTSVVGGGSTLTGQLSGVINQASGTVAGTTALDGNTVSWPWLGTNGGATTSGLQAVTNLAALGGAASLSNNTLSYGGGAGSGTFNSPYTGVLNGGATAGTLQISGNTLLNSYTNSTGDMVVFGSMGTSAGLLTISNNRYENSATASTGQVYFINASSASRSLLVQGNTFRNFTKEASSTATVYGYYNAGQPTAAGTHTITANTMVGLNLTGTSGAYASPFGGILATPGLATTQVITNNIVGQLASGGTIMTGAATLTGIFAGGYGSSSSVVSGNTIQSLLGTGTIVGITTTASLTDPLSASGNCTGGSISGNIISHLGSSNRPATVCGVFLATKASAAAVSAYGNKISNLTANGSTGSLIWGMYVAGGANIVLHNNLIANLSANAANSPEAITGIYLNGGADLDVYYNTIYLAGGSSGYGFGTAGIAFGSAPSSIDLRNNLVVNLAAATGNSLAAALRRTTAGTAGTVPANLAATLNNNLWYGPYLYAEGLNAGAATNALATLAAYRRFMYTTDGREQRAVSQAVGFNTTNSLDNDFLRPGTGVPTPMAGGAQPLSALMQDFSGVARSSTTPDIGAREGGYTYLDQVGPAISYAALGNTSSTANPTLANVSVADPAPGSGVPSSPNTRPRLYYKLASDANTFNDNTSNTPGWKYAVASGSSSPFSFTLDYNQLYNGPDLTQGAVVQYFVVAQDGANNPNVAFAYGLPASVPTGVDLKAAAFPLGSSVINSFTIAATVVTTTPPVTTPPTTTTPGTGTGTGTSTPPSTTTPGAALPTALLVGAGQAYTSLTNAGGAFEALNVGVLQGNTTLTITSNLTGETGAVALSAPTSGSYTLTIKSDGQLRTISGVATSLAGMVRLAGADRVTITGAQPATSSQNLLFSNYTSGAPVFSFTADASDNTLTNLLVESSNNNSSSGTILLGSGTATGNDNNAFSNLNIRPLGNATTASFANGIFSTGAGSTIINNGIKLTNSVVHDFSNNGFYAISNSTSCTVTGNSFYQQGSRSTALCAVRLDAGSTHTVSNNLFYQTTGTLSGTVTGISVTGGGSGSTISGNLIGGSIASGASATMSVASGFSGIVLAVGTGAASTVQGNTIQAITNSSQVSSTYGINVSTGTVTVANNLIGNSTSSKGLVVNYDGYGISIGTSTASTLTGNQIVNLQTGPTPAAGLYLLGINFPAGTSGTHTVATNLVSSLLSRSLPDDANDYDTQTVGLFSLNTGQMTVQRNQFNTIGSLATTTGSNSVHHVEALHLGRAGTGSQVSRNRIYNLLAASPGTGAAADVVVALYNGGTGTTVANNQLSVGTSASAAPSVVGILENGTANTYAYNSVYLGGRGSSDTYSFYRASTTAGLLVRNNILYNDRAGNGHNLAIGTGSAAGWAAGTPTGATSDYNLFFTSDSTEVGNWAGSTVNFTGWKRAQPTGSGGDRSSMREQNTVVSSPSLFGNASGGDLALNVGGPAAWYANGTGVQLPGLNTDYAGNPRSTTVAAGAPDIGALEVTPTGTPPDLFTSGRPSRGGTQTFWLGGRPLARVTWGQNGSVPNGLTVRYYSGTNPPTPYPGGSGYANVYFTLSNDNNSGNNYTYFPTLYYDPALLGVVAAEADQLVAQRTANNGGYDLYASVVSPVSRTLAGPSGLTRLGLFAIGSWNPTSSARTTAPLATLTRAEAAGLGLGTTLGWRTDSETDNAGFEVQVSLDGTSYRSLGFVAPAAASSATAHDYTFLDAEASLPGRRYYRLRQLDLGGRERFSAVRTLTLSPEDASAEALRATPNPFGASLTLHFSLPTASPATVHLTDAAGRVVRVQDLGSLPAGPSQVVLDNLSSLPAGLYVLRVVSPTATYTTKVTKE